MKSHLLVLFALLGGLCGLAVTAAPPKPNVIFILADDLGWSDTTLNRPNAFYETPHLERLAQRGLRFTQAYAANPLCSPTRSSILTGLYPARIGITAPVCHVPQVLLEKGLQKQAASTQKVLVANSVTRLDTNYYTLAEAFQEAGYVTGHFGKWHLGPEPYSPLQQGFNVDLPHWPGPGPAGSYVAPWRFPPALKFAGPAGEHIEDRMAREAIRFLEAHQHRPFFLNYWAFSVHAPFDAKQALIEKYRAKAAKLPPESPQRHPVYGAMVQSLDENIGRLLDTLDRLRLTENTIIVFFSDNGGVHWQADTGPAAKAGPAGVPITSNTPLRGGKATTYEGGTREPCLIVWPGLTKPGAVTDTIIQSTDFFPTLAELLKLKVPETLKFDGKSFAPALRGEAHDRGPTFCHFPHSTPASGGLASTWVRVGDWKLIRFYALNDDQTDLLELYNLREDLSETKNLAAQDPAKARELNALIDGFLKDTAAVVPRKNPAYDPKAKPASKPGPSATASAAGDLRLKLEAAGDADAKAGPQPADPLQGWKARGCDARVQDGVLVITGKSAAPFLGFAAGRWSGPTVVKFRARSATGGAGKVEWLPTPQAADQAKSVPFQLAGGEGREVTVELPSTGRLGILRLYLPAQQEPVELDWVELRSAQGKVQRWDF